MKTITEEQGKSGKFTRLRSEHYTADISEGMSLSFSATGIHDSKPYWCIMIVVTTPGVLPYRSPRILDDRRATQGAAIKWARELLTRLEGHYAKKGTHWESPERKKRRLAREARAAAPRSTLQGEMRS